MHPQLSDKKIGSSLPLRHSKAHSDDCVVCKDFIQALEACHATGWKRFTGACNDTKNELNKCLHGEVGGSFRLAGVTLILSGWADHETIGAEPGESKGESSEGGTELEGISCRRLNIPSRGMNIFVSDPLVAWQATRSLDTRFTMFSVFLSCQY